MLIDKRFSTLTCHEWGVRDKFMYNFHFQDGKVIFTVDVKNDSQIAEIKYEEVIDSNPYVPWVELD